MTKKLITGISAGVMAAALPRAIQSFRPRADVSDPVKILADLQKSWADFQASLDEKIAAKADPLIDAKVDKINASVGELQAAIDKINLESAARALNAQKRGQRADPTPEQRAHTGAYLAWMRGADGDASALRAAQIKATMTVGSDPDGGYLVPFEVDPTIDRVANVQGGLAAICNVKNNVKGASWKKLVSQGGATAGWVGETEARPATGTPTLSEIEITLEQLYVNAPASQQVLDDGDVEGWLDEEVMVTFDEYENAAIVAGNGVKKPRGLMDYPIVANASYAWGSLGYIFSGAASDFAATTPDNALQDMVSALKQKYRPNARWIGNRSTIGKVRKFKDTTGQPLWQPSIQLGEPSTLLGYPTTEDDNFADVGAGTYPLAFGDFKKAYTLVRKPGLMVNLRDPYTNKPFVMFYMVRRVGGGVTNFEAAKVLKIATS